MYRCNLRFIIGLVIFSLFAVALPASGNPVAVSTRDYPAATLALGKLTANGTQNADLYNQLGLGLYHQGQYGKAVLWFLRALRLQSSHSEAKNNLKYALSHSPDRELYPEQTFLSGVVKNGIDFFNLNALAMLVLSLLILVCLCGHWLLHLPTDREKAVPVMWTLIIGFIFLVFTTMLISKYRGFVDTRQAVVIETETMGFSGPGIEYGKLFTIHSGLILHITKTDKDWALVTLPNGGAGWIPSKSIESVRLQTMD